MTAAAKRQESGVGAQESGAKPTMPKGLKAKGWKLEERTINDDEIVFLAGNETLGLYTGRYPNTDEAIEGAIILQSREDGKGPTPKQAAAELKRLREEEAKPSEPAAGTAPLLLEELVDRKLIRIDGGTQPREELDQEIIAAYAEAKRAGAQFPAVDVFFDGKHYWLADGFHRFFADKACGFSKTYSRIHQGTQRDAVLFSLGANETHGKRRSPEDKRRAVLRIFEDAEWKKMSDSAIADVVKASQPFVSTIRREINRPVEKEAAPSPLRKKIEKAAGTADLKRFESTSTKRVGKDKVERETEKIGVRSRESGVRKAATDIRVDDVARNSSINAGPKTGNVDLGNLPLEVPLVINLSIKAGKSPTRGITISGRAGEGKPIFLSQYTLADLRPMPRALGELVDFLAKRGARMSAAKPATKKKPARKK